MGLAPYGKPAYVSQLRRLIETLPDGQFRLNSLYFDFAREDWMHSEALIAELQRPARGKDERVAEFHCDVAPNKRVVVDCAPRGNGANSTLSNTKPLTVHMEQPADREWTIHLQAAVFCTDHTILRNLWRFVAGPMPMNTTARS